MTVTVWCDLETTGLDPLEAGAEILEIALVAVNADLVEVAHWSSPIVPWNSGTLGSLPPRLVEMHSNSGLLGELRGPLSHQRFGAGGYPNVKQAESVALQFMAQFAPHRPPLAGANPTFDLGWLRKHMPALAGAFHPYRTLDTNFCFLLEAWLDPTAPQVKGETRHRALHDCRQSIDTLRRFLGAVGAPT